MPTDVPRPFFRRLLRWALWTAASLFLIGVLGFAYVTFVGITLDASLLRGRIATVFSDALGRTVRFDGPMVVDGFLPLSDKPGIGVEIDEEGLRKHAQPDVPFFE